MLLSHLIFSTQQRFSTVSTACSPLESSTKPKYCSTFGVSCPGRMRQLLFRNEIFNNLSLVVSFTAVFAVEQSRAWAKDSQRYWSSHLLWWLYERIKARIPVWNYTLHYFFLPFIFSHSGWISALFQFAQDEMSILEVNTGAQMLTGPLLSLEHFLLKHRLCT